jgi:hypothetical protein
VLTLGLVPSNEGAAEQLERRLERLRQSAPNRAYEEVRRQVLLMKDAESAAAEPSTYWREELRSIEYMLDASPLVIERLRHHAYHVTGVRPYDYRSGADEKRQLFVEKLSALRELDGEDLLVAEPELLGGFGFRIDGRLFNIDTLKFYEALIALRRSGALADLQRASDRPVVVEIGPGWGGFAYQLKTLFPQVCCVLVDLPELFLFSAVYLMSAFPHARVAFWSDERPLEHVVDYDFVFIPHGAFPSVDPFWIDLAINMVSFQEMTSAQVQTYVDGLFALGCPALYSLNRDRSSYNSELTSVCEIIASRYRLEEIEVLPVPYTKLVGRAELDERHARGRRSPTSAAYRHVIGRLEHVEGEDASTASRRPLRRSHRIAAALRRARAARQVLELANQPGRRGLVEAVGPHEPLQEAPPPVG